MQFFFRNYDAEIFAFSNRLGEKFNDLSLRAALTHKSYIERETARLSDIGVESNLQFQDNEALSQKGGELLSKFTNGYLRAVFTQVPEELIRYNYYALHWSPRFGCVNLNFLHLEQCMTS